MGMLDRMLSNAEKHIDRNITSLRWIATLVIICIFWFFVCVGLAFIESMSPFPSVAAAVFAVAILILMFRAWTIQERIENWQKHIDHIVTIADQEQDNGPYEGD